MNETTHLSKWPQLPQLEQPLDQLLLGVHRLRLIPSTLVANVRGLEARAATTTTPPALPTPAAAPVTPATATTVSAVIAPPAVATASVASPVAPIPILPVAVVPPAEHCNTGVCSSGRRGCAGV